VSRRALVLGVGGFLGSHLARYLLTDGWVVAGVVRDLDAPHVATRLASIAADVRLVAGDATDADLLGRLIQGVDAVFPFAGHSGASRSLREPFDDLVGNAGGQLAVLEALRRHNPGARVVFPGSRLQYGLAGHLPVGEDHPQQPVSLYGLHKMVGEHYHRLYHELYGLPTCSLRISNPYGPGQDRPDRAFGVVGNFLATAARGEDIAVYGGGTQLRDYVHVDDVVELCAIAATHPAAIGQAFNAGGPAAVSVKEMAEAVVRAVGRGRVAAAPWPAMEAAVETGDYVSDLRRVHASLGWQPQVGLETGLAGTWQALAPVLAKVV
jgi:nucleoside-diphosphate-sugar epimerase